MGIGTAIAVAGITGAAVSAAGAVHQGLYSAAVARNNAKISEQNAAYATEAGNQSAQITSLQSAAEGGSLKANQGASGVDVNTGSAVSVQAGQRAAGQLETETTLHNALLSAYGYQTQAESDKAQAQQDIVGGFTQAGGGLLENASSLGFKWAGLGGAASASGGAASNSASQNPWWGG